MFEGVVLVACGLFGWSTYYFACGLCCLVGFYLTCATYVGLRFDCCVLYRCLFCAAFGLFDLLR